MIFLEMASLSDALATQIFEDVWNCSNPVELMEKIVDFLSDFYVENPEIRSLEYQEHFFNCNTREHFYVADKSGDFLDGFKVKLCGGRLRVQFSREEPGLWQNFLCEEELTVRRTMGDVFDEF